MKCVLLIIISFSIICCDTLSSDRDNQNHLMNNQDEMISTVVKKLNNWNKKELECYEWPNSCPDYIIGDKTNEWINFHKKQLEKLNRIPLWNIGEMEYESFFLSEYHKVAIRQLKYGLLKDKDETVFLEEQYYTSKNLYHYTVNATDPKETFKLRNKMILDISNQSIIKGDLNHDNKVDFVVNYSWHHFGGNQFGVKWLIFISTDKGWMPIPNNFENMVIGTKKETIKSITNGVITTELILNKNNPIIKRYRINNKRLEEIK